MIVYCIKSKNNRKDIFTFQDENGTQKKAVFYLLETAETILKKMGSENYYISKMEV